MWRRRRTALNEAMHELRRPLQALALAGAEGAAATPAGIEDSVRMAATALEHLDREINGGSLRGRAEEVAVAELIAAAVERWRSRALAADSTLVRGAPDRPEGEAAVAIRGDRWALSQALDNLVVNAIEHGGSRILVSAAAGEGTVRITVRDCGRPLPLPGTAQLRPGAGLRQRLGRRARHGHGLRVVRRVAAAHGGRFALSRRPGGALAVLELPAR